MTQVDYILNATATPMRLALAAQMHAALLADPKYLDSARTAARIALDHADALILEYAVRPKPRVRCSVCNEMTNANPCAACAPTLNDE
jgi:hypothetical protein